MKVFILTLFFISGIYSSVIAQVKVSANRTTLGDVMQDIAQQAAYHLNFKYGCEEYTKLLITRETSTGTLNEVLDQVIRGLPVTYEIDTDRKMITLTCNKPLNQTKDNKQADTFLKGTVRDDKGDPVWGATVMLHGEATMTDENGIFYLRNAPDTGTLIITRVYYKTKIVKYRRSRVPKIRLQWRPEHLKETTITAPANDSIPKEDYLSAQELSTSNIQTVTAKDIEHHPGNDLLLAMSGKVAGASFTQTSGMPNAAVKVEFRGQNSMNRKCDLLYVIDGVPFNPSYSDRVENATGNLSPFSFIDKYNIESVTMLKDAAATALYGARAANGAMLITMKKGKAGKAGFDIRLSYGWEDVANRLHFMNKNEYTVMRKEAFRNESATPKIFDYDLNENWESNKSIDWQKELIGGTALFTDGRFTCYGGRPNNQFFISAGYRSENTVFPGEFVSTTKNLYGSFQHQSEDGNLSLSYSLQYNDNNNIVPRIDPTTRIYTATGSPEIYTNGQLNWANRKFYNPFGMLLQPSNPKTKNLISNLTGSYKIAKNLQVQTSIGYNRTSVNDFAKVPLISVLPSHADLQAERMSTSFASKIQTFIVEPQIIYKGGFGDHNFDYQAGFTFQQNSEKGLLQKGWGFENDSMLGNPAAASMPTSAKINTLYKYSAVYTRIGYNYQEKYVTDFTHRLDRSSRFGPNGKSGDFWAVGAAWIFSNESFIKNWKHNPFRFAKLSGSIGRTGSDQIPDYQYLSIYDTAPGYFGDSGLIQTQLGNVNYSWEIIHKIDLSVVLEFPNSSGIKVSVFRNRTKNQLFGHNLPATTGYPIVTENLPVLIQNIGMEFEAHKTIIKQKYFTWDCSFNLSVPQNKLISSPDLSQTIYAYRYAKGYPLNVKYFYDYEGVNPNTGLYQFKNKDGDKARNEKDMSPYFVGQLLFGGLEHTLSRKGLSLTVFFQYVIQKGYSPMGNVAPGQFSELGSNQLYKYTDRWQRTGDQSQHQKYFVADPEAISTYTAYKQSNAQLEDASFIRIRNISLSWTIPEKWKLSGSKIFMQGQNLFTLTKYKGLDPEPQEFGRLALPPLRIFSIGIQASFGSK